MDPSTPIWLFDGDCGLCEQGAALIRERIHPPVTMAPYQSVDIAQHGVDEAAVLDGPVLRQPDGTVLVGPEAMGAMLAMSGAPYRALGHVLLAPGLRHVLRRVGPVLYRQRGRLPGAGPACAVTALTSVAG
jgi:hypothetical protein